MPSEQRDIPRDEGNVPVSEMAVAKGAMIDGAHLEEPVGDGTKEKSDRKEMLYTQDEGTRDKDQESESTDNPLGFGLAPEDGESGDTIGLVACDILEVFDREEDGVGKEEEE